MILTLSRTIFDWIQALPAMKQALGRSASASVDAKSKSIDDYRGALGIFLESAIQGSDPIVAVKEGAGYLKHISHGFLFIATKDTILEITQNTSLAISTFETIRKDLYMNVVTGTLEDWKIAVINGSTERASYEFRKFANECHSEFEKLGLGSLWSQFTKESSRDSSILLLPKR